MADIREKAQRVLEANRVAVFIVAYHAEKHIQDVLERIPDWVAKLLTEIFVIDDNSSDQTSQKVEEMIWDTSKAALKIFRTPSNQGYGGNQKIGYAYAIEKDFDIVVLLHGDGQYAPESLPDILAPYDDGVDAVFGSRFLTPKGARKGGMPLYKWLGNRILTRAQNCLLGSSMSEMHSGYRSYRTACLKQIPFHCNSKDFHFDAEIIVQHHDAGFRIHEVEIPTYYGDEICRVNGMKYAYNCIKTFIKYRLMQLEVFYDPKFDIRIKSPSVYTAKEAPTSLHYFIKNHNFAQSKCLLDVGGGDGSAVAQILSTKYDVTCVDQYTGSDTTSSKSLTFVNADLNGPWQKEQSLKNFDVALALDVIEHMHSPEACCQNIHNAVRAGGTLYASTGNVGYFIIRLMLLFGYFNYGRRGILDLTHTRLMTVSSFRRLLSYNGFEVKKILGFGPPIMDMATSGWLAISVDRVAFWLARLWPQLFAFHFLAICERKEDFQDICLQTTQENLRSV